MIELDSHLNIVRLDKDSEPMYYIALINTDKTNEPGFVDIF